MGSWRNAIVPVALRAAGLCLLLSCTAARVALAATHTFTNIVSTGPTFFGMHATPAINTSGVVSFRQESDDHQTVGMYTGSGGAITTITDTTAGYQPFAGITNINDSGTVAFRGVHSVNLGIFKGNAGGPITTIADNSGPILNFNLGSFDMTPGGTVAFRAELDDAALFDSLQIIATYTPAATAGTAQQSRLSLGLSIGL